MKTLNRFLLSVILILLLLGGLFIFYKSYLIPKKYVVQDSTVVLEKINKVMKLVTVEGQFSEITKHEEWYGYNISPLRKKVLVRVNAKVLVGYDLQELNMDLDESKRMVYINELPGAEILSMDDDLEYYDISEGLFTSFSKEDYTSIQKKAESIIRKKALESGLIERAEEQRDDLLQILGLTLEKMGWQLKIREIKSIPD